MEYKMSKELGVPRNNELMIDIGNYLESKDVHNLVEEKRIDGHGKGIEVKITVTKPFMSSESDSIQSTMKGTILFYNNKHEKSAQEALTALAQYVPYNKKGKKETDSE